LFWSAVINGIVSVPVMVMMMLMTARTDIMKKNIVKGPLCWIGWLATAAMAAAVIGMIVTSLL
ncbi:TPA: divalent metal cation transporter, partial [Escherichia coli]|nr:divalent metal cation transporter [Escherichia coli]